MAVKILTDSACDLTEDIIKKYDIDVLPILVYLDEKEYLDRITIAPKELFDNMRAGMVYKTAQIPPKTFEEKFKYYAENNISCIYIAFSSGLSGTYQTSLMVRNALKDDYPNLDIEVIDSKSASVGFGLLVYKAARMAKEGKSKEEILKVMDFYIKHIEHIFSVDDIEYLYRGGRVSRAAAFIGSLLNIKPILDFDDGKIVPREKIRGRNRVIKRMVEIAGERGVDLSNQVIGINHGDDLEGAEKLIKALEGKYGCKEFVVNILGASIGAHSGPGTLSVFFLNKEMPEDLKKIANGY